MKRWKRVAIIGAAGKMGRGIAELLTEEMARRELEELGAVGTGAYRLVLIDTDEVTLFSLRKHLRPQIIRYAEKGINELRAGYASDSTLVSNQEIIDAFVQGALDNLHLTPNLEEAAQASVVFEAIVEDQAVKAICFQKLNRVCKEQTWFLSNTSSIPISEMAKQSGIEGRLVGFHFYNPPPIQALVEVVIPDKISLKLKAFTVDLGNSLRKKLVESADVPGFIGNGHFLREIAFASEEAVKQPGPKGIELVDAITRDLLLRPMGIFQLVDFVGIDVCDRITKIMDLPSPLISQMVEKGILGGQTVDGQPRDGFFHYEGGSPVSIYHLEKETYVPLSLSLEKPKDWKPWKQWLRIKDKPLKNYFSELFKDGHESAQLAKRFLEKSALIANELVQNGVAKSEKDVAAVLMSGFHHLYHPAEIVEEEYAK